MVIGGVSVLAAALASLARVPPRTVVPRPGAVLRFIPYFLFQSLRGGLDVSLRVFRPTLPLRPAILVLPVGLPEGPARVLLASVASLMPGTLAVRIAGDGLHVHVLDDRQDVAASIAELERRIAAMLG
jgi:multicomponent Na+:H+ antiporter subunit E